MLSKLINFLTSPMQFNIQPNSQGAFKKKTSFLKMQLNYVVPKIPNHYLQLFDIPFKKDCADFEITSAYLTLTDEYELRHFEISVLNLRPDKISQFVSFNTKKKIYGGDLVFKKDFFQQRRNEFIDFAKERQMAIGSLSITQDSLCVKITQENQEFYLIDPYVLQPKSFLYKFREQELSNIENKEKIY